MKTTTIGVFTNRTQAEAAIVDLKASGISDKDISCVYTDKEGEVKDSQTGEKVGEGAAKGATTGAVVGAIAGLVVANGILPGIGTLFVAGPIATALGFTGAAATTVAGAVTGAAAGGLIGALTELGIDKEDAALYEGLVERGDVLVVTRSESAAAMSILSEHGASEIREYTEA
jgi:hypothetical protein